MAKTTQSSGPSKRPNPSSTSAGGSIHKKTSSFQASTNTKKLSSSAHSAAAATKPAGGISKKSRSNQRKSSGPSGSLTKAKPIKINYYEQQKLDRLREKDERKAKKEEKLLLRKKERNAKLKILTKKNRKGQPIMGGRMELLLQQIQKGCR